jgi:predicted transposase YbfD/YdcC
MIHMPTQKMKRHKEMEILENFEMCFEGLEDPRIERKKLYPLKEILLVVLSGAICGVESWRDLVLFGEEKLEFLREYMPFKNGIPCKNTFARVISSLDPKQFRDCFIEWAKTLPRGEQEVIAIDGKTLCNSENSKTSTPAIHMVSAFATGARLVLAQEKVNEKSNEITAIPELLKLLDIKNQIITLDAMGCQKNIAKQIREKEADYILALKGNQGTLNDDVRLFLETEMGKVKSTSIRDTHIDITKGHGRIESRKCVVTDDIEWLTQKSEWEGLKTLIMIEEIRQIDTKASTERRFFISSMPANAEKIAHAVRSHWAIENALHWMLDVVFNEDYCRVRIGHGAENMSLVRHFTLNMLRKAKPNFKKDTSIKALRKLAGWGNKHLRFILQQVF